jgi:hypothetical protein
MQRRNAREEEMAASMRRAVDELAQAGVSVTLDVASAAAGGPAQVIARRPPQHRPEAC